MHKPGVTKVCHHIFSMWFDRFTKLNIELPNIEIPRL